MERKSVLLRIDPTLWADLEGWAQIELRSINGQIEYLLREAVQKRKAGSRWQEENEDFASASKTSRREKTSGSRKKH